MLASTKTTLLLVFKEIFVQENDAIIFSTNCRNNLSIFHMLSKYGIDTNICELRIIDIISKNIVE